MGTVCQDILGNVLEQNVAGLFLSSRELYLSAPWSPLSLLYFHVAFKMLLLISETETGLFYLVNLRTWLCCAMLSLEKMKAKIPKTLIITIKIWYLVSLTWPLSATFEVKIQKLQEILNSKKRRKKKKGRQNLYYNALFLHLDNF